MLRQRSVLYDFINGIAFKTSNKKDPGVILLSKEVKVIVAPIQSHNTTGGKVEIIYGSDISSLPISDHCEIRQIGVVVQEQMEFDGPFGLTEVRPGKQAQTKVHYGGIEIEQH
jgi:bifunctional N-acetylglucosamine-1-phosphate-uridyltransferase/glucosamine-1-phosphate-acetyltransferase GlmU-like protein